jgi:hypothetical protein
MGDKEEIEGHFRAHPPVTSELTFTNLWMWQNYYHFEVARVDGFLCFLSRPSDGEPWCLPPVGEGDVRGVTRKLLEHLHESGSSRGLERVPEELVQAPGLAEDPFSAELDRDQSDYVYLSKGLIELSGRALHAKKNQVNKFKRTYAHEYRKLSADLVEACLHLETAWCDLRHCWETPSLAAEEVAIHEALHHFGELSYVGGVILVEGKVEAFALGEPLNRDTFVIHVEKANPAIDGLYAAINQMFCEAECAHVTYVNREQDLGVPGLRRAKESYHPDHLVHKYRVTMSQGR